MADDLQDLERRLRAYRATDEWGEPVHHVICDEAADALESLQRENAKLREALAAVAKARLLGGDGKVLSHGWNITKLNEARPLIEAALAAGEGGT